MPIARPHVHHAHHVHLRGLVQVAAASVLWGTGGLAVQLLREQAPMSPVTVSAWRMAIAAAALLVLLLALRRHGELVALVREHPWQVLAVGTGTAAYQGFYFASVTQVGVAVSTVVSLGLAPVLLTVVEAVRHRRRPTAGRVAVLATALTGLVLVSAVAGAASIGPDPLAGVLLAVASGATYALTTQAGGPVSRGAAPVVVTSGMTLVGALVLLPTLVFVDGPRVSADPVVLGWLLYLGTLTMALAYLLFYAALRVTAASTVVTASLLEPVTAAVVAAIVLDEALGLAGIAGTVLVLVAVAGLGRPAAGAAGAVVDVDPDADRGSRVSSPSSTAGSRE